MTKRGVWWLVLCAGCSGRLIAIPPPPPVDGGEQVEADVAETGVFDASSDAAAIDEPVPATSPWCAAHAPLATLCDDFEDVVEPRVAWSPVGALAVVDTTSTSPSHALAAKTATPAYLAFTAAQAPCGMKVETDFQLDADGTVSEGDDPVLVAIDSEHGPKLELAIVPGTSNARCTFAGFTGDAPPFIEFALARDATWHSLSMKLSLNDDGTVNLFCLVDGVSYGVSPVAASEDLGAVTVTVGARGATATPVEAYFDDVVIND